VHGDFQRDDRQPERPVDWYSRNAPIIPVARIDP
jgi:hypothetical protein